MTVIDNNVWKKKTKKKTKRKMIVKDDMALKAKPNMTT